MDPEKGIRRAKVGEAYAFPVEGGAHAICRVIGERERDRDGLGVFVVSLGEWGAPRLPSIDEAAACSTLVLTYFRVLPVGREVPAVFDASGLLPEEFLLIGLGQVRSEPFEPVAQIDWAVLSDEVFLERLYRSAPDRFRPRYNERAQQMGRRALKIQKDRRRALAALRARSASSDDIRAEPTVRFAADVPSDAVRRAEEILLMAKREITASRTANSKREVLRRAIVALNEMDHQFGGVIDTGVAEELVAAVDEIGREAGLRNIDELIETWRAF